MTDLTIGPLEYARTVGFRWWPCEELVRAVARREETAPLGRTLEVGCGNGGNLWFIEEHSREVVGLDRDGYAVGLCRKYMASRRARADVVRGNILALPFEAGSFDSVVDCMVSQHVGWADHVVAYREYRRVLRPGGWLFLYHLNKRTHTGHQSRLVGAFSYDNLDLFPDVGLTCLPRPRDLRVVVEAARFAADDCRGLIRRYPRLSCMRDVEPVPYAHYSVIEAIAV